MAQLLQKGSSGNGTDETMSTESSTIRQTNSKADIVELAIEYIKILRKELVEMKIARGEMPT